MDSDEKKNGGSRFSVLPLTVSLETVGGIATPIVLRGTPLPTKRSQVFSTAADNQTAVSIQLFFGERPIASDNYPVGTFEVAGIPPALRGEPQIQVIVEISAYCDITVRANDKIAGSKLEVKENRKDFTLNTETIRNAIEDAERNRTNDQQSVKLAEQVVKRQGLISKAEKKLREDTDQLSNRREIEKALAELGIAQ